MKHSRCRCLVSRHSLMILFESLQIQIKHTPIRVANPDRFNQHIRQLPQWPIDLFLHRILPPSSGGKCLGSSDQIFSNSSYKFKWICAQDWLRSFQWPRRLGIKKEIRKTEKPQQLNISPSASRYPCGLIIISTSACLSTWHSWWKPAVDRCHGVKDLRTRPSF